MATSQRKSPRFSLDLSATLVKAPGSARRIKVQQISVGGCLTERADDIYVGDEFRLELDLPNNNRLPLTCKAIYSFDGSGVGAKFLDITEFEQELIARTIRNRLEQDGVPMSFDPTGPDAVSEDPQVKVRPRKEEILDTIMTD